MKKKLILFCFLGLAIFQLKAQIIVAPTFPNETDSVTIFYDATRGNGALAGQTSVFIHIGVVTNLSTTNTTWRYTQGTWGTNDPRVRMTLVAPNLWSFKFHARNFFSVPAAETIQRFGMVFRNATGSIVGRNEFQSDIFTTVYRQFALAAKFTQPVFPETFINLNQTINLVGKSTHLSTLTLFLDGVPIDTALQADSIVYNFTATQYGNHWLKLEAINPNDTVEDSLYFVVRPPVNILPLPNGVNDGINYLNDSTVILCLFAPKHDFAYALGDFNNWVISNDYYMNMTPDSSRYWVQINQLTPGIEYAYQYLVENLRVADPYCDKILDPQFDNSIPAAIYPNLKDYPTGKTLGTVSVLQTAQQPFVWQTNNFQKPAKEDLIVYELLVRDFTNARSFQAVMDSINYLANMGINCIHLMPTTEFDGNISWGYNPNFMFAVDKAYGPKNKLKELIDLCHSKGIAVVLDIVLNHAWGGSPLVQLWWDAAAQKPALNSPYFNRDPKHDFNVGYDFNHWLPATVKFRNDVVRYWMQEYRFDGYRFDLSKGFTQIQSLGNMGLWGQLDPQRVALWKAVYDSMQVINPGSYCILEHFADNSEETQLANYGMILWGNMNYSYSEAVKGQLNNSDLSGGSYRARGWQQPGLLTYMESHDEERVGYRVFNEGVQTPAYSTRDTSNAMQRMAGAMVHLMTIPGPKMVWMWNELGYDISLNQNGRTGIKPTRYNYLNIWQRKRLQQVFSTLCSLKTTYPVFKTTNFTVSSGTSAVKLVRLQHPSMNLVAAFNAGLSDNQLAWNTFPTTGTWYEYFTGDSVSISSSANPIPLPKGAYALYTSQRLPKPNLISLNTIDNHEFKYFWNIYPNPSENNLNINLSFPTGKILTLEIYDLQGRLMHSQLFQTDINFGTLAIPNTNELSAGMYIIKLSSSEGTSSQKWIKN